MHRIPLLTAAILSLAALTPAPSQTGNQPQPGQPQTGQPGQPQPGQPGQGQPGPGQKEGQPQQGQPGQPQNQDPGKPGGQVLVEQGQRPDKEQQQKGEGQIEKNLSLEDGGDASAEGGVAPSTAMIPSALPNYAFAHVTTRPRRLAPGESGNLVIVLALNTPAVVTTGTTVSLEYATKQGALDLGTYAVQPAPIGTLDTRYKGLPVYDNTVTLEIPVTIGSDAQRGDVPVALTLKTQLVNGADGNVMGDLTLPVSGRVHVGKPLPRPIVASNGGAATAASATEITPERPEARPTMSAAEPVKPTTAARAAAAPLAAMSAEGIAIDVAFAEGSSLEPGASLSADVTVRVPPGKHLARAKDTDLTLEVSGDDDGIAAIVTPWPAPSTEQVGEATVPVSAGTLSVPVNFSAADDAALGQRNLTFRLTYALVGPDGATGPAQTLAVPAVLAVGSDATGANPLLLYAAGGAVLLLLAVFALRAARR